MATTAKSSSKISPLSPAARKALEAANTEAKQLGSPAIGSEHLLLGLIADQSDIVAQVLTTFYSTSFSRSPGTGMAGKIRGNLPTQTPITDPLVKLPMNSEAAGILTQAKREAETANNKTIDTEHLLSALMKSNTAGKNFLIFFAFNLPAIERMIQDKKKEANDAVAAGCGVNPSATASKDVAAKFLDKAVAAYGAATTIAGAVSDAIKNVKNPKSNPGMTRVEWIQILDKAIDLSKKTGISVPSCFIQVAMSEQSTVDRAVAGQIRADAIQDLISVLTNQQKSGQ